MTSGVPARRDDLRAFLTAHPVRHLDRFGAHVLQAVLLHLLDGPLDGVLERLRSAEPIAERVAEVGEPLPGGSTTQRLADETCRRFTIHIQPA